MRLSSFTRVILSACTRGVFVSIVTLGACLYSLPAHAHEDSSTSFNVSPREQLIARLVNTFWESVQRQDVRAYSKMLAPKFQGINIYGVYDRAQQIAGLQGLTVKKFKITHVFAAKYNDTLTISYNFTAEGRGIVSGPSIDIWQRINQKWKLISHTYVPYQ